MIFDTHSHCYWDSLLPDIEGVIGRMQQAGVTKATQIGCDIESSKKAIQLAHTFPNSFFATVGFHPESAQDEDNYSLVEAFESLILENRDKVVAIGETGLDFHYLDGSDGGKVPVSMEHLSSVAKTQIERQKNWWRIQHELASKYNLPLVIHTRDARDATLDFMKEEGVYRAVMHCFSEDFDFAQELLEFSDEIYFSFSGIVTYKSATKVQEAARRIPLERILIETDAPFLAPQRVRGQVCEPAFTRYTLEKIAELRDVSPELLEGKLYENSIRFFGISY